MRIIQRAFFYVISIVMIGAGAAAAMLPFNQRLSELAARLTEHWMLCLLLGFVSVALGFVTLLPSGLFGRKGRCITFAGPTGTVSIQIDPFETSLRKTIAKLPMIKRVSVAVAIKDNKRKVGVVANVSLKKPEEISARDAGARLLEFVDKAAKRILGADEVASVDVVIDDVQIDPSQTAESLNGIFAAAEKSVEPAPRSITPYVSEPARAEPIGPVDEGSLHDGPAEEEADAEASEVESATPVEHDDAHSSDLLTYEEAEEMRHARASEHDAAEPHTDAATTDSAPHTSFESLAGPSREDDSVPGPKE